MGKKYILNWLENSGMKCRFLYWFRFLVLLDAQANLPETSPLSTAQMAVLSSFFQGFIVLGMYNFGVYQKGKLAMHEKSWQEASALAFI